MEKLFAVIKYFLTTQFNEELAEYDDPSPATELPRITDKSVTFGAVDPLKIPNVSVSVLPESQEGGEGTISDEETKSKFTVTFVFKGEKYSELIKRMCRYSACFKQSVAKNYTLNEDSVQNVELGSIRFYCDCGQTEKSMTAAEIDLTIYTSEEY
jgi:hypothetical protein